MLIIQVAEDEIVQFTNGCEQILLMVSRVGRKTKLKIVADTHWRVHRGTMQDARLANRVYNDEIKSSK